LVVVVLGDVAGLAFSGCRHGLDNILFVLVVLWVEEEASMFVVARGFQWKMKYLLAKKKPAERCAPTQRSNFRPPFDCFCKSFNLVIQNVSRQGQ
jgi:hypothetical protein